MFQRFSPDNALHAFEPTTGWSTVIDRLPFSTTRHLQMRARRDRLLFIDATHPGQLSLHSLRPPHAALITEAGFDH